MSVATVELDKREREILRGSVQSLAKNLANNLRAARFTEHWTEAAEFEQQIRELVEVYVKLDGDNLDTSPDEATCRSFPLPVAARALQVVK